MSDIRKSVQEIKGKIREISEKRKIANEGLRQLIYSNRGEISEVDRLKKTVSEFTGWRAALKWCIQKTKQDDPLIFIDDDAEIIAQEPLKPFEPLPL